MYSPPMRRTTLFIFTLACASLFATQVSDLHLHAEDGVQHSAYHVDSHAPQFQHSYLHHQADHEAHADLAVLGFATGSLELDVLPPNNAWFDVALLPKQVQRWSNPALKRPIRQRSRWRPPLRAPPFPV